LVKTQSGFLLVACAITLLATASSLIVHAQPIEVTDDLGHTVRLDSYAQRILTLSPHATELVFAAGGGDRIVATVNASDFPAAARTLPRIGDGLSLNPERILAAQPDLIIGWQRSQLSSLAGLNIPIFLSNPTTLEDIVRNIEILGTLMGVSAQAGIQARTLRDTLAGIKQSSPSEIPVRVFIQIGDAPEYTLNHSHLLSKLIEQCGGVNVFRNSAAAAPKISAESIIAQKPEVILVGRAGATSAPAIDQAALQYWTRFKLPAALAKQVYVMDSDVLYRPGPRLIEAADAICALIQQARK
jgi:vitamin B12 transport system substrate-binding protein